MDAFALLQLPRQLTLEERVLHQAYAALSRTAHPDHGGSAEEAAGVNAAYELLRSPEKRIKHLLEIAAPPDAKAWRAVPLDESMMALFSAVGAALDTSAKYLEKRAAARSALARALLAGEELEQRERMEDLGNALAERLQSMEDGLPALDEALAAGESTGEAGAGLWKEIAGLQARFAYVIKWQAQVRERLLQLTLPPG
jgi:curved DNA-binding protein CbpA